MLVLISKESHFNKNEIEDLAIGELLDILIAIKANIEQDNKRNIYKNMLLTIVIHGDAEKTYKMLSEMLKENDSFDEFDEFSDDLFVPVTCDLDKLKQLKYDIG